MRHVEETPDTPNIRSTAELIYSGLMYNGVANWAVAIVLFLDVLARVFG